MLLIARGLPTRWAFALRRPSSWRLAAGLDAAALVVVLVVNGVVSQFTNPGKEQGLIPNKWEPAHAAAFFANAAVVIILAPISEELVFRGLGFRLLEPYGRWTAILGVGFTFALVHGLVDAFPVLFVFGTALAYIRARTGSVYPTMILHATFNALAIVFFFL
jgi:membrane protease YdiL (CAAX protease family)